MDDFISLALCRIPAVALLLVLFANPGVLQSASGDDGYQILRTHAYLPPDFDDETFAALWTVWPEPDRSEAEAASPTERRRLMFSYYGLMRDPEDVDDNRPALGYVSSGKGDWVMSCLACHGGKVAGRVIPGLPNSHYALQTLTEDVRLVKLQQRKKLTHMDLAISNVPLNVTNGTTNSVIFGVLLGRYRNPDMSVDLKRLPPPLTHHDMDAPPFWNVRKKTMLYVDGFSPKTHRPLMQFMLIPGNSRETVYGWEDDFKAILDWIESVPVPKYPGPVDAPLADLGRKVFEANCASCHGTYGPSGRYEQQTVAWDDVQTDPVRLRALTPEHRRWMKQGWMSRYGEDPVIEDPQGYVAPPLDGIWASAPYFHNGSVPTLWHVLHPENRPPVWKRTEDGYDHARVGLEVEAFSAIPESVKAVAHKRRYFDTRLPGKSAGGHTFPAKLTEDEKLAVLEYLKTL
ncbi:MAG TPA: cytochrome c [Planctomycetaceae bacterium]|nr:cytochrome c [Planctomycetaceae bacterium]